MAPLAGKTFDVNEIAEADELHARSVPNAILLARHTSLHILQHVGQILSAIGSAGAAGVNGAAGIDGATGVLGPVLVLLALLQWRLCDRRLHLVVYSLLQTRQVNIEAISSCVIRPLEAFACRGVLFYPGCRH